MVLTESEFKLQGTHSWSTSTPVNYIPAGACHIFGYIGVGG